MAVVGAAPCQCFSPGANQTTSPGRIPSIGPPQRCARPHPAVRTRVWPSGCVCHAVRAPGSKRYAGVLNPCRIGGLKERIDRHGPSEPLCRPLAEGCELTLLISISCIPSLHGRYSLRFERTHVDRKAVLHIGLEQSIVGFVDLLDRDDFDIGGDVVLRAEIEHLLSFGDAADARA
jgi:hypothetical protein